MTDYTALLNNSGLKATYQRLHILETIEAYGHVTVDFLYEKVSQVQTSLSLATVYKNILLMVQKGVLVEVALSGQKSHYELSKESHLHLVCTECGEIEDRPYSQVLSSALAENREFDGFQLQTQQVSFYGVCRGCQGDGLNC
jgi:Fur family peroxide stress response transcriptional regulator